MAARTTAPSTIETSCTVLFHTEKASAVQQEEIMRDLESPEVKASARHVVPWWRGWKKRRGVRGKGEGCMLSLVG
jgi:hypothetical protein